MIGDKDANEKRNPKKDQYKMIDDKRMKVDSHPK